MFLFQLEYVLQIYNKIQIEHYILTYIEFQKLYRLCLSFTMDEEKYTYSQIKMVLCKSIY